MAKLTREQKLERALKRLLESAGGYLNGDDWLELLERDLVYARKAIKQPKGETK